MEARKGGMPCFSCQSLLLSTTILNWGEPERAPHKCEVCVVGLSVCLSICLSVVLSVRS